MSRCDLCGRDLRNTEERWGRCGPCAVTHGLPPAADPVTPASGADPDGDTAARTAPHECQTPGPTAKRFRYRPLRHCECGAILKGRKRRCDGCGRQAKREAGRQRVKRFRQQRTEPSMAARPM